MSVFRKYPWEEIYRYFQFKRDDSQDGLDVGETIASINSVTSKDKATGIDMSATMLSNISIFDDTQVTYLLKAGVSGSKYILDFKAISSRGQKLEGSVEIGVF